MARISLLFVAFLLAAVAAPTAMATNVQGFYRVSTDDSGQSHVADGSRAHLKGSGVVPTDGKALASIGVEGATDGLYQFGQINVGNGMDNDCGMGYKGFFAERKHVNQNYLCNDIAGTWGSDHQFAVKRNGTAGWTALLDGNQVDGPYQLAFPDSGLAFALAEYDGRPPDSYSFTWGPGTEQPWQWTYGSDLTWHTVDASTGVKFNPTGFWTITALPSPFTISK